VQRSKKFDAPVPLSEFAKRGKTNAQHHSGHGRRDALSAGERTRILRMLRDEGGRLADEESQVFLGNPPARDYELELDDSPSPSPAIVRPDIPAKPAVVVGLAQAQAARGKDRKASDRLAPARPSAQHAVARPTAPSAPRSREQRLTGQQTAPRPTVQQAAAPPPSQLGSPPPSSPSRSRMMQAATTPPPPPPRRAPPPPVPFGEEPTRQVDDALLAALRNAPPAKPSPKPGLPRPSAIRAAAPDEPTRTGDIDSLSDGFGLGSERDGNGVDDLTRPADDYPPRFLRPGLDGEDDLRDLDEATRLGDFDGIAAMDRSRNQGPPHDERTRAVNIRNDPSISDIDWDLD
jgi:hypothetical protein